MLGLLLSVVITMASTLFKSRLSWCLDEGDLSHRCVYRVMFRLWKKTTKGQKTVICFLSIRVSTFLHFCFSILRLPIFISLSDIVWHCLSFSVMLSESVSLRLSISLSPCTCISDCIFTCLPVSSLVWLYVSTCLSASISTFLCLYICLSVAPSISHSLESAKASLQTWTLVGTFLNLVRTPQWPPFNGWSSWVQKQRRCTRSDYRTSSVKNDQRPVDLSLVEVSLGKITERVR